MKKFCPNCGTQGASGASFCAACRSNLKEGTDSRDVCPQERQQAFIDLKAAQERFRKVGGKV